MTAHTRLDDARLRRAQALGRTSGVGLDLARELISTKIEAQANTLARLSDDGNMVAVRRETVAHVRKARMTTRRGVTPRNTLSNYCYGVAAAEARIACIAAECDAGLGFLDSRPSPSRRAVSLSAHSGGHKARHFSGASSRDLCLRGEQVRTAMILYVNGIGRRCR